MLSALERLRAGIKGLRRQAADKRYYIDPQELTELCEAPLINEVVEGFPLQQYECDDIKNSVVKNGIVTFSILAHIRKEQLMPKFVECDMHDTLDGRLPLGKHSLMEISPEAADDFFEAQWEFRPVILAKHKYKQINDDYVLPFMFDKRLGDHDGSFGDIYEVTIKSPLQKIIKSDEQTVTVIRKQIRFNLNKEGFARERKCLETLQRLEHPNIVELLCSYTYKGEHSLLFRCEDMDLHEFLTLDARYKEFESDTVFYTALYGLASALEYVHNNGLGGNDGNSTIIGYHHDIRPHNILVRSGTFLLADFGLAKMNEDDKLSSSFKGGGGDYMAPECLNKDIHVGRAADIWSLGGMMVDIASYMEGGPQGRTAAQDRREADGPYPGIRTTLFFSEDSLKVEVIDTIEQLQKNPRDKTIRTLLILSRNMLQMFPDSRLDANEVRENAAYIAIKSLFRAALERMIRWKLTCSREKGPGRVWTDTWKLWAWGEEIGINGANLATSEYKNALSFADNPERKLQKILMELIRLLDLVLSKGKPSTKVGSSSHTTGPIYIEESDRINNCIRDLRRTLPEKYGVRIEAHKGSYYQYANLTGPSALPEMPSDDLQTPLHAESSRSPAAESERSSLKIRSPFGSAGDLYSPPMALSTAQTSIQPEPIEPPNESSKRKEKASAEGGAPVPSTSPQLPESSPLVPNHSREFAAEVFCALYPPIRLPQIRNIGADRLEKHSRASSSGSRPRNPPIGQQKTTTGPAAPFSEAIPSQPRDIQAETVCFRNGGSTDTEASFTERDGDKFPPSPASNLNLPSPIISSSNYRYGPLLLDLNIFADVTRVPVVGQAETLSSRIRICGKGKHKSIVCEGYKSRATWSHRLSESECRYPHTNHSTTDNGNYRKIYFLGRQIVYEQKLSTASFTEAGDEPRLLRPAPRDPEEICVEARSVQYELKTPDGLLSLITLIWVTSDEGIAESRNFREAVWGKELVISLDVRKITWPSIKEAELVVFTLWKEHSAPGNLTVVFRAQKKDRSLQQVELQLAKLNPEGRQEYEELFLNIEPDPGATPTPKPRKGIKTPSLTRPKPRELRVKFGYEEDCDAFSLAVVNASMASS